MAATAEPGTDGAVALADGRRLAYTEYGDPGGAPVMNCHGGLSCRLDVAWLDGVARELGVRLVSPDRPGIGGSDRCRGRTLLDWPADVAALADALGSGRFAVMGWSLGGQYAAACGHALGERVTSVALVAGVIPVDWPDALSELNSMDRRLLRLSTRAPVAAQLAIRAMHAAARGAPKQFRGSLAHSVGRPADDVAAAVVEGTRRSGGALDDYLVYAAPWGFDLDAIDAPVELWQGDRDELCPAPWARRLSERIGDAEVHPCPGDGHLLPRERYAEILARLAR
jgi:pimeloyl-ACP methyl ester carboxylesterase